MKFSQRKILLIEPCNFVDYPTGGQLTFAKHLIKSFGNDLMLVGLSTEKEGIGRWTKIVIDDVEFDFFPYWYLKKSNKKPLIPLRLRNFIELFRYRNKILTNEVKNVITQSPDSLVALKNIEKYNVCYYFAGVENPLKISRYKFARNFSFIYDYAFLPMLSKMKLILAAADNAAINDLIHRSRGQLNRKNVFSFPTRVNTNTYKKIPKSNFRKSISIKDDTLVITTTGRLSWIKGWKLMIDSFQKFQQKHSDAVFFIIGNGEDETLIKEYILSKNLNESVFLTGFKEPEEIANYLNASDIFIMGSLKEGWSTSLIEAVCCGVPCCVTNFSSALDIIREGINGYVCENRDIDMFAELMGRCIQIDRKILPLDSDIEAYSLDNLKKDLLNIWSL